MDALTFLALDIVGRLGLSMDIRTLLAL